MLEELKKLIELIKKLIKDGFHGKITVHFANGVPRKVEINHVTDL